MRIDRTRVTYWRSILRQGPTETGYAFFRARRRRRNLADEDLDLAAAERLALDPALDVAPADLDALRAAAARWRERPPGDPRSVLWIVPWMPSAHLGGIHTILRVADHLARERGIPQRFWIDDRDDAGDAARMRRQIAAAFPSLASAPVEIPGARGPAAGDAAIATTWRSAYRLARLRSDAAPFLFVQDFEPAFHPAGSASALLEAVCRFGIPAIVNTPGLADVWRAHGGEVAATFTPAVDAGTYHPPSAPRPAHPVRIVFYGRPRTARNAFTLGLRTLRLVKERHGAAVEIVSAGEDWNPGAYGAADILRNLGRLDGHGPVSDLYRSAHIGLTFMLTPHPSYPPLEQLASGTAVVMNDNPHIGWLLRDDENALLAPAVPTAVADAVSRLVEDPVLRERLAQAGRARVLEASWPVELDRIATAIAGGAPGD